MAVAVVIKGAEGKELKVEMSDSGDWIITVDKKEITVSNKNFEEGIEFVKSHK